MIRISVSRVVFPSFIDPSLLNQSFLLIFPIEPRSRNECVNLCIIEKSFQDKGCLNYYNIVTRAWLHHLETWNASFNANTVKMCRDTDTNGVEVYFSYIRARRFCDNFCARDCLEENYSLVTDQSSLHTDNGEDDPTIVNPVNKANESVIVIWPDRKMYEIVEHHKEIDFFELIGSLGGHAHIWLGLSAIQLYDVVVIAIAKIKVLWQRFVYCA